MPGSLSSVAAPYAGPDTITDPRALESLAKSGKPEAIRAAAKEFESLFLHQLFKSMRSTIPKEGMMDAGMGGEMFTDMLDQEYAKNAAQKGGIGLADMISEQFGAGEAADGAGQHEPRRPHGVNVAQQSLTAARGLRTYGAQAPTLPTNGLALPIAGGHVSSEYGMRQLSDDPAPRMHDGLDIAAPEGTPIQAAQGGTVAHAGWIKGYGNAVILDHGNGTTTLYGHASELLVKAGERVERGAPIAKVGNTGHSTGPHLHFEVRQEGRTVDPRRALGLR